jgi:hypothetical protein
MYVRMWKTFLLVPLVNALVHDVRYTTAARPPPHRTAAVRLTALPSSSTPGSPSDSGLSRLTGGVSAKVAARMQRNMAFSTRTKQALSTLMRVALPTVIATVAGFVYFDNLSLYIRSTLDVGTIRILQEDDAQFIQNFLTVIGLLFSILAGNAYSALYQQQESIYFALFQEVSEAKSLLEQTTLVCQGRPFYPAALSAIRAYVKNDLRRLDIPPARLLSTRPADDPLEAIMYLTSVGVPSIVYETVKNLRQARGYRLGAMQRKFPFLGIGLLYLLAAVELLAFPLLGAGTASIAGVLSLQSFLFAMLCGAHMLVLRIIQELWQSSGGVFNVDEVLQQMVFGLEEELELRAQAASPSASPTRYEGVAAWQQAQQVLQPPSAQRQQRQLQPQPQPQPQQEQEQQEQAQQEQAQQQWLQEQAERQQQAQQEQAPQLLSSAEHTASVAAATDGDAAVLDAGYESAAASLWSRLSHQPGPPRLPRPQRRLLGQFGRTLQGLVQIIGKN